MKRTNTLMIIAVLTPRFVVAEVSCANQNTAISPTTDSATFVDNGDGTVTHSSTELMWMRCSLGQSWSGGGCIGSVEFFSWQGALKAAADLNSGDADYDGDGTAGYAGYSDWRLPNKNELASTIERQCWAPSVNASVFPDTPSQSYWWTSSTFVSGSWAWAVNFGNAGVATQDKDYIAFTPEVGMAVRLVRSPP